MSLVTGECIITALLTYQCSLEEMLLSMKDVSVAAFVDSLAARVQRCCCHFHGVLVLVQHGGGQIPGDDDLYCLTIHPPVSLGTHCMYRLPLDVVCSS